METHIDQDSIKHKVVRGAAYLTLRRILFQIILTLGNIILARILSPSIFGTFAIISFLTTILGTFATFGFNGALIQGRDKPSNIQLKSIFTLTLISSGIACAIVFFSAPYAKLVYPKLVISDIFWLKLFSFKIILSNLQILFSSLLEKRMDYKNLTILETSVLFLTQFISAILAVLGLGLGSYVLGNLFALAMGVILSFILSGWPLGFGLSFSSIKKDLSYGLNFLINSIFGVVNWAVIPGFVGAAAGPGAVGFINWAGGVRQAGVAPVDIISRLVFPACSRCQDKPEVVKKILVKIIHLGSLMSFPLLALIFVLARPITVIVYTSKWLPGLTALYLALAEGIFFIFNQTINNALLALGYVRTVRNISLFWTLGQWILTIPLVLLWNYNGVMLASLIVSSTFFIPLAYLKRKVDINIWPHFLPYLFFSIASGLIVFTVSLVITINTIWILGFVSLFGLLVYSILVALFKRKEILNDFSKILELRHA